VDAHNEGNLCPTNREIKRYQAKYHLRSNTTWTDEWYLRYKLDSTVTIEKVRKAIKSFKAYKTPNGTGIYPKFLHELPDIAVLYFTIILQRIIQTGYTPRTWLLMDMILINKPGRQSYHTPKDFRPITLSSFCLKVLERIMKWEIECHVTLPLANQYAFTKGLSTETVISKLVNNIEIGMKNKKFTLAVLLDIQGAFDNVT